MDISTGEGAEKSGDRRRAKAAMQVGDKASEGKGLESEQGSVGEGGGIGGGGTVKNHKSEERCFFPVRKGRGEVGVSNRKTEVELKTAWP